MKGNASVHDEISRFHIHRGVHFLVHQSEYQCLVTDKRLVVAFSIADGLLIRPLVRQFPPYFSHAPLLVALLFQPFDPMVRDSHSHAEIESESAGCERSRESGHAAHVFRNRNRIRVNLFRKHGREGKIGHGILVDTVIEIIVITDEVLAEAVVPVQHAGHAVEPEAVQVVFFHPELAVRE